MEAHLAVIDELDEQIEELDKQIERRVLESPAAQLLLTIPGVGQTTAAVIVAELGEIDRFDTHKEVVSYAGLDPMEHQSGETELHESISKEGPGALRWALVQSARIAVRCEEYLGNFYTRLNRKKNDQVAIVATARKMLVSVFYMLKRTIRSTGGCQIGNSTAKRLLARPPSHSSAQDFSRRPDFTPAISGCCLVVSSFLTDE